MGQRRRFEQRGEMSVITIENVRDFPAEARGAYVTVGNFDGVHRGHQRLLARLRAKADAAGVPALAITFDPHPVALLRPDKTPVPLVWPQREIALLEQAGATHVGVFQTGPWLLELSAREFFDRVIREPAWGAGDRRGPELRVRPRPPGRRGDLARVVRPVRDRLRGRRGDRDRRPPGLVVVDPAMFERRQCGRRPRGCWAGRIVFVARSPTEQGGAGLGFPTANLESMDTLVPLEGVYAGLAWVGGQGPAWPAACNIGPNPTFGETTRKVEAHLIGFTGDLYGKTVELDFLERLRGTQKFSGLEELLGQIQADIEATMRIVSAF